MQFMHIQRRKLCDVILRTVTGRSSDGRSQHLHQNGTGCYTVEEQAHGIYIKKKEEEMIEQNVETNDRGPVGSTFFRFEPWTS